MITDTSDSHGNLNRLFYPNAGGNGANGIHIYKNTQPGDDTDLNLIESGNLAHNTGDGILLGDGARTTTVRECWFEIDEGLTINGPNRSADWNRIIRCHCPGGVSIDNAHRALFINNVSPVQYSIDVTITSNATDTYLENNNLGSLTDNGTGTVQDHFTAGGGGGGANQTALRVHNVGGQTIPSGSSFTTVDMTGEQFDTRSEFDLTSDTFTADSGGTYEASGAVLWPGSTAAGTECRAAIFKNGSVQATTFINSDAATAFSTPVTDLLECAAGDTITLRARQDSGSGVGILGGTSNTMLSIRQV